MEPYTFQPLIDDPEPDGSVGGDQSPPAGSSTPPSPQGSCPSESTLSHREGHQAKTTEQETAADGTVDPKLGDNPDSASSDKYDYGFSIHYDDPRGPRKRYMIRVLILLPGKEGDDIRCELTHTYISRRLQDPLPEGSRPYEALSYTWGDLKQSRTILLAESPFEVTVNLEVALRHLRLTDSPRVLWVDAVCIDQRNFAERNRQVLRMNLIYEQAYRVVVWLGEESVDSTRAMDVLEKLGGKTEDMEFKDRSGERQDLSYVLLPKDSSNLMAFADLDESDMRALDNILQRRAWWSRMWVIQEIAYSSEAVLVCGHRTVDWATINSLLSRGDIVELDGAAQDRMRVALRKAFFLNQLREHICYSRDILSGYGFATPNGIRLRDLLEEYEHWQCKDPRDKVFALLGIHGCPKSANLQVNYSNTVSKVYTDTTFDIIYDIRAERSLRQEPSLEVICSAYKNEIRQPDLPSWVPDWSQTRRFTWCRFKHGQKSPFTTGGRGRLASLPPISDSGVLAIEGILWDWLLDVSNGISCFMKAPSDEELRQALQSWEPGALESMTYPTKEDILDVYWLTLLGGIDQVEENRLDPEHFPRYKEQFLIWSGRKQPDDTLQTSGVGTSLADSPFQALRSRVFGFTIATTVMGYLTFVPVLSEPGDLICVVPSLSLPLILRESVTSPSSENTYTLVGPCYVHGIMDGEVMTKLESGEVKRVDIKIV